MARVDKCTSFTHPESRQILRAGATFLVHKVAMFKRRCACRFPSNAPNAADILRFVDKFYEPLRFTRRI